MRHALDAEIAFSAGFELLDQMVGDGPYVTVRTAGGNHHAIGDSCLTVKINCHDIFGLRIVELGQDGAKDHVFGPVLRRRLRLHGALRRTALLQWCCQGLCPLSICSASSRLRQSLKESTS